MDQEQVLLQVVAGQARIEQQVKDMSIRLLGGEGQKGVLSVMFEKHEALDERVDALEGKKNFASGWIAGAGAVGGAVGGLLTWLSSVLHHAPKGH